MSLKNITFDDSGFPLSQKCDHSDCNFVGAYHAKCRKCGTVLVWMGKIKTENCQIVDNWIEERNQETFR
jgi:hypothetical protein